MWNGEGEGFDCGQLISDICELDLLLVVRIAGRMVQCRERFILTLCASLESRPPLPNRTTIFQLVLMVNSYLSN